MKPAELNRLKRTAVEAAEAAGRALMKNFGKKLKIKEKPGAGLVSNADLEAEEKAVRILTRAYPDFGFLTEESPPKLTSSPGRWIIDPLDGTNNFIHGFPMFCVSIVAEFHGNLEVGVIYHPVFKDLYLGVRGKGATLNGKKLRVSSTATLKNSLLTTGFTYRKQEWLHTEMLAIEKLSSKSRAVRRPGSAALDLAYTARGVFDGFWEQQLNPWDVAAGVLILREAGGRVTDFKGREFQLDHLQLLASNGSIHNQMLGELHASGHPAQ
ncbi:MAG: inositol monophosphatase [Bdellovibrio sp.]|nr:inositol monophosphatase [Bdellovibrio sp.]